MFKNKYKRIAIAFLTAAFFTILSGCQKFEPLPEEETGRLRITAGTLSGYSDLRYAAVITSRTKPEQTADWEGSRFNTVELPAGLWNIALCAIDNDEVIAAGNVKNVEVILGEIKSVTIELKLFSEEETGKMQITAGTLSGYSNLAYEAEICCDGKLPQIISWDNSRTSHEFELSAGLWNVALTASSGNETIAAGTKESVNIIAGEITKVTVDLNLVSGGDPEPVTEEGTLSITVTNTGSFPGASYAVTLSGGGEVFNKVFNTSGTGSFTLTTGVWDIALSVKIEGAEIAIATETGVLVEKDKQTNVTLTPVLISGTGTFSWTVNYPNGQSAAKVTKAEMKLTGSGGIPASGYNPHTLSTTGTPGDTVTLDSGSWTVEFYMEMQWGSSTLRSVAKRSETVAIVNSQTLNKTYTFDYKDFVLLLEAAANSGSAYPVITSKGFDYESPDQAGGGHESFGSHILQKNDSTLGKNVFEFIMHRNNDRNATGDWTRQRLEVKLDHRNGNYGRDYCGLDGADEGRSFIYRWKFRLPADFAVSTDFTHIHQIKNEGGDSSQPVIALTARTVSGNQRLQLTYYAPGSSSPTQWVNDNNHLLTPYLGRWVQCEESVTYSSSAAQAAYSLKITRIDNGQVLMNHTAAANTIQTWRTGNTHGRPKFGLYRLIFSGSNPGNNIEPPAANAIAGLKDETILYADFEVVRLK
jgi:hypothetical protein